MPNMEVVQQAKQKYYDNLGKRQHFDFLARKRQLERQRLEQEIHEAKQRQDALRSALGKTGRRVKITPFVK